MLGHRPVQLVGRTLFTQSLGADWSNLAWCEEEATASSPIKECHTCLSRSALLLTNSIYPEDLLDLEGVGCIDTGQKDVLPPVSVGPHTWKLWTWQEGTIWADAWGRWWEQERGMVGVDPSHLEGVSVMFRAQ